jgi:glycosyltransferase involved in cell wall biosynthesis
VIRSVLMLAPEPPYPLNGGGAYRTASLVHYFAGFAEIDLILFSECGKPALLPPGLVRSQTVVPLPRHGKGTLERWLRNAGRAVRGVPPLIDRLAGFEEKIKEIIGSRRYDLGVIEHFWCAPYVNELRNFCAATILDLHNVESVLNERCAAASRGPIAVGHRRFARMSQRLESTLLPQYSLVLATSEADAARASEIAPGAKLAVYPNALPLIGIPAIAEEDCVVFSANFEYHPNIDAAAFLISEIWPLVRMAHPVLRLRLVGRGDAFIRRLIPSGAGIETTGPVEDALSEIARAKIVVAPLRVGSGTRIKILEAWAAAKPVIATPLAAEGLRVEGEGNILLEREPAGFAAAVSRLLKDTGERQRIGVNGRHTFEDLYTWEKAWRGLDRELQVERQVQLNRYTG